jgi:hypothetical protein
MKRCMRAQAGAWSARSNGPIPPYMLGSAECWATFGKLLTRNEADAMHQLATDAYASRIQAIAVTARRCSRSWRT